MTGIVKLINESKKLAAVETSYGDYMILRLIDNNVTIDIGDKLEGELTSMGEQNAFNITKGERVMIDIEETYLTRETAETLIK
jgi:hypothetical protein